MNKILFDNFPDMNENVIYNQEQVINFLRNRLKQKNKQYHNQIQYFTLNNQFYTKKFNLFDINNYSEIFTEIIKQVKDHKFRIQILIDKCHQLIFRIYTKDHKIYNLYSKLIFENHNWVDFIVKE